MLYNSLVLPLFDYLDIIYNHGNKTDLKCLDITYKKVGKIALNADMKERSITVYKEMNWLPLHLRRQLHLAKYVHDIINEKCPKKIYKHFSGINRF